MANRTSGSLIGWRATNGDCLRDAEARQVAVPEDDALRLLQHCLGHDRPSPLMAMEKRGFREGPEEI